MLSHYTGLPLPLHQPLPFPQPLQKNNNPLAPHQPSQTHTIPCSAPRPCLPSKKGRWHGCRGFSACCTVFRWSCFYDSETIPSRDGGDCSLSAPSMRFSALSLAPHHVLASLVKGEVLSPEKIRATTGGIAPYPHHQ